MGITIYAQLNFGIAFEEDNKFPWNDKKYNYDIDKWWEEIKGFKNLIESPFDENGNYKTGFNDRSQIAKDYFKAHLEWGKANPLPVQVINYSDSDDPKYIIATKTIEVEWGEAENIDITLLGDTEEAEKILIAFLTEFGIETMYKPNWLLSAYCWY